eukprot:2352424-Pyramimonas_sp.AAC.1
MLSPTRWHLACPATVAVLEVPHGSTKLMTDVLAWAGWSHAGPANGAFVSINVASSGNPEPKHAGISQE